MFAQKKSFKDFYYPTVSKKDWKDYNWQLNNRIRNLEKLSSYIKIDKGALSKLGKFEKNLNFSITPYYLSLINPENEEDPIRKQCVPTLEEFETLEGESDPLGEKENMPVSGLIHKYPDRALILATNICPVYCRHCFRRGEWDKGENVASLQNLQLMFEYIKSKTSIKEVIISGGDPLFLSDFLLDFILRELRKIGNVEVIRIASRVPVVLPQRITKELSSILKKYSPIWFVTHFNHFNEITDESSKCVENLLLSKAIVLNQTVLLKGINDNSETIEKLFRALLKIGVKPYYLFECDPAKGVTHFRTSLFKGLEIMESLRGRVSGLAQPTFALDTQGGGKVPLLPNYVLSYKENSVLVRNYEGKIFEYQNPYRGKESSAPLLPFEDKIKSGK